MTEKADFLASLRIRLKDPLGNRWDDEELDAYLVAATYDYSKYFPRQREMEFTTDGILQRYDSPTDLIDDFITRITVLGETSGDPSRAKEIQQKAFVRQSSRWFEVVGEEIVFGYILADNLTIQVRYSALHQMPNTGDSSIPLEDEEMVLVCAGAMAWMRLSGNDAALSRWKENGKRDDNPVIPEHSLWWARYKRMVEQKKSSPRSNMRRVRSKGTWRSQ